MARCYNRNPKAQDRPSFSIQRLWDYTTPPACVKTFSDQWAAQLLDLDGSAVLEIRYTNNDEDQRDNERPGDWGDFTTANINAALR